MDKIGSLSVSELAYMASAQVHMFLSKLTSTSVGLTAWDMVVINKPTVLMVCYVIKPLLMPAVSPVIFYL